MRKNQKGFTLVELIIAVAILAIVTLAVCGFIVVGSRSYTSANTDIMLQQDAQLALNQISDVIIDTTDSISYGVRAGGVGDMQLVLKDSEFGGEATEKCLAVVNKKEAGSNNDNESYWFYWSKEDEIIYFNKVEAYSSTMSMSEIQSKFEEAADQSRVSILAQHVTDFSVDLTQFEANRVVMLSVTFENGNRMYSTSNNVTVRNRIALNELTVGPLKRAEEFVINTVTSVTLEPGDTYSLASKVTVTTPGDDAITFEQVGGTQYGTSVDAAGMVTIGKEDMRDNFSVKVSRTNEQYAGENDRVARTIKVNIKRATDVNITGPASAKQGETVDLTGIARGNLLGVRCDQCIGDDLSKDWDVYDWQVISGDATITVSGNEATVKIGNNAKVGEKIVIQAASVLSRDKNGGYGPASAPTVPPVTGRWEITVQKGTEGDFPIEGGFKFGTDNDPGPLDYMRSHLRTDFGYYIYAVRVREMNAPDASQDMVVLYETTGANERFFPDLFGLTLDRSYKVFFQVFVPLSPDAIANKDKNGGYIPDDRETIVNEYLNNVDSNGKYVGERYEADGLYYGLLSVPTITVTYNGVAYPNNLIDHYETIVLRNVGAGSSIMGQPSLADAINVDRNTILNSIHYSVFKGEGESKTQIYEYKEISEGNFGYEGNPSIANGLIQVETGSMILKKNNDNAPTADALGIYSIVPGFTYKNNLNIRQYKYLYPVDSSGNLDTSAFKKQFGGDYDTHYYPQEGSVIKLKLIDSGNLPLTINNSADRLRKVYVPLPTESDFTSTEWGKYGFKLETKGEQTSNGKWLAAYDEDGKYKQHLTINVTCNYRASENYKYELKITGQNGEDYGTYGWNDGQSEWTCITPGRATNWP